MLLPMRNVFDQYTQPENRLTHALATTLDRDRSLLRPFLRWAGCSEIPAERDLSISEQQLPGKYVSGDEHDEGRGLPDASIFDENGWTLLIESKVQSGIGVGQIKRHIQSAARCEYPDPFMLVLAVDKPSSALLEHAEYRSWREVYSWFYVQASRSVWARELVQYFEIFESKMIEKDYEIRGTITMFNGVRFDDENPYNYREAKRLIRLLGDELQDRKDLRDFGVDPDGARRSAITGREDQRIWDFLPLAVAREAGSFTDYPHLTMGLSAESAGAAVTVPNGVKGGFRTRLRELGWDGFFDLLCRIETNLRPTIRKSKGAKPLVYALQRHYPSQRSAPIIDARSQIDLRTVVRGSTDGVKYQPEWVEGLYNVMCSKRSNIQLGISVEFRYGCPVLGSPKATDLFAESWMASEPLIEFVLDE
jgi:hypothetical protein